MKPIILSALISSLLSACMVQDGNYQETNTVRFNGSGNSITETTTGSYHGNIPITGSASLSSPNLNIAVSSPSPRPIPANYPAYPPPYPPYYPPYPNPPTYYQNNTRSYSDGNTTITRDNLIIGGCTQTVHLRGQTYQTPIPCN